MRILITGATGFVGTPLARALYLAGHELVLLSRDATAAKRRVGVRASYVTWDPLAGPPPAEALQGIHAVFNLMGENLGAGRWSAARKQAILDSRIIGTRHLVAGFAAADQPALWVNFSAIGFYPVNRPDAFDENGRAGDGFPARVCAEWEAEAAQSGAGRRVVLRVGTVLGANGGALEKLLPPFKAGVGGPVGAGRQLMSWIHRDDLVALCLACLDDERYAGVINAVAPEPISNRDFSRALGRAVRRPALLPAPPLALKIAFGEMAQLVLDGQGIVSSRLPELGFDFRYGDIHAALEEAAGVLPVGLEGEIHVCDRFEDFCVIDRPLEEVFAFFGDPYNLEQITPPLLRFRVAAVSTEGIRAGTEIDYALRLRGLPLKWRTLIREWVPDEYFVDFQLRGPYQLWNHTHRFLPVDGGTAMLDRVDYELPLGPAGGLAKPLVGGDIRRIFDYRRKTILSHFA
ncbi:MAG: TIGR01777 family oxidoreductase [Pseudomonadota bacterium]